jgi:hypothetical protein
MHPTASVPSPDHFPEGSHGKNTTSLTERAAASDVKETAFDIDGCGAELVGVEFASVLAAITK